MEDKEIVKALEDLVKCNNNEIDCDNCSLSVFYPRCPEEIGELSLDLINRLQAENKRLKAPTTDWLVRGISPEQLEKEKIQALMDIAKKYAKAEAYKECIEKVKPIISEIVDLMFDDYKGKCVIHGCVKPSKIACNSEICIQENKQAWEGRIDNLLKELVGD